MANTYGKRRCAICALRVSKNGLATSAHAKYHVRVGELVSAGNGRYTQTPKGVSKAFATAVGLEVRHEACVAAGKVLDQTSYTQPEFLAVYAAYTSTLYACRDYVNKQRN